jgi:predicted DNA-binding protein (MmcQ/YjbR family)
MTMMLASAAKAKLLTASLMLPGATPDTPWGEAVAKVGGKVFVFFGHDDATAMGLGVKLTTTHAEALAEPNCQPSGYGLGRSGWVSHRYGPGDRIDFEVMLARVQESYHNVVKGLPKKAQAIIAATPAPIPAPVRRVLVVAPKKKVRAKARSTVKS